LQNGFDHAFLIEPSRKIGAYAKHLATINGFGDKITIISSTIEDLRPGLLPDQIDLLVSENLSSVIFGFGSWDRLPEIAKKVRNSNNVVPRRGKLFACLTKKNYAARGRDDAGLAYLAQRGLNVDLFERTFRSGGNVFDKASVHRDLIAGELLPQCIASFDLLDELPISTSGASLSLPSSGTAIGLLLFWVVELFSGDGSESLSSLDAALTSWYPLYVSLSRPHMQSDTKGMLVSLNLCPVDHPYKYAIQFTGDSGPLTQVLYW
jgi:hypothetical protein